MTEPIVVDGLVKRYGSLVAVDGISFTVRRGEVFALLGPNGAGKTTTVEILEGFRRSDAGHVAVLGRDPRRDLKHVAPRMGVMPQQGILYSGIRCEEAVRLFASFYPDPADPDELLRRLGLDTVRKTNYRRLSGGEQQRLSLALALVGRPELLFLDEPVAGMDVHARHRTWEMISELRERGTTVLLTTHLLEEAERLADRVAIIHRGRVVATGSPSEITGAASGRAIRFHVDGRVNPGALGDVLGHPVTGGPGDEHRIEGVEPTPELLARLAGWLAEHGLLLEQLTVGSASLEEVFLELTREEDGA